MTTGAVFNHALSGPIGDAFTMGTPYPVFLLPEVALTAHLIAVIHIDLGALFGDQKISFFFVVTGITGQGPRLAAVIEDNFAMGDFSGVCNPDRFIIMTLAAFETLHLVFAGIGPEAPSLISFRHQNGSYGKRQGCIDLLFSIKRGCRILVDLNNAAFYGIRETGCENQQQYRQNPPETIFK
jgi:hypothetical protein